MAGLWPSLFFLRFYIWTSTFFMDREEVENSPKKRGQHPANLVNKGFIVCLSGKCFLRDTAGCPERAR